MILLDHQRHRLVVGDGDVENLVSQHEVEKRDHLDEQLLVHPVDIPAIWSFRVGADDLNDPDLYETVKELRKLISSDPCLDIFPTDPFFRLGSWFRSNILRPLAEPPELEHVLV